MRYGFTMKIKLIPFLSVILFLFVAAGRLRADEVDMQNGDRYFGKVLSVSGDTVVMNSEMLGKINVPRKMVAGLVFGTNTAALVVAGPVTPTSGPTNPPAVPAFTSAVALANTNVDLAAALRRLGTGTNFVGQIRQQMLAGSPEAAGKYDEMVNGLMSGNMNLNDLRQQAKASADQLRELKRELGPEADESLDAYLQVLDSFVKETDAGAGGAVAAPQQNATSP